MGDFAKYGYDTYRDDNPFVSKEFKDAGRAAWANYVPNGNIKGLIDAAELLNPTANAKWSDNGENSNDARWTGNTNFVSPDGKWELVRSYNPTSQNYSYTVGQVGDNQTLGEGGRHSAYDSAGEYTGSYENYKPKKYMWAIPLAAVTGGLALAAMGGGAAAAGAAGAGAAEGAAGAAGAGLAGGAGAGAIDLGGGLMMAADGSIIGGSSLGAASGAYGAGGAGWFSSLPAWQQAALQGAGKGALTSGVQGQNPLKGAFMGALTGGAGGAAGSAISGAGGAGWMSKLGSMAASKLAGMAAGGLMGGSGGQGGYPPSQMGPQGTVGSPAASGAGMMGGAGGSTPADPSQVIPPTPLGGDKAFFASTFKPRDPTPAFGPYDYAVQKLRA